MHELSVCLSLLQQVETIAVDRNASTVDKIFLQIGPLSGIEPTLLRNAYPLAAAGTVAADAELIIETSSVVVNCTQCDADTEAKANRLICSSCGDFRTQVVSGDEMILQRLEMNIVH